MAKPLNLLDNGSRSSSTTKKASQTYESIKSKGEQIFNKQKTTASSSKTKQKDNNSLPSGIESIYRGSPTVYYEGLTGGQKIIEGAYKITIVESMDQLYRTGMVEIAENKGFSDSTNIYNSLEGEKLIVKIKGIKEKDVVRTISFDIGDMEDIPWEGKTTFSLKEAPYYRNYTKELKGRSFDNVKASELIGNILAEDVKTEALFIVENASDPKFPSFIMPNWTPEKLVRYLSRYSDLGPIKTFNISIGEEVVTMLAPLDYFMRGQVYAKELNIFPSTSDRVIGGYRLNQWKVYGPRFVDSLNAVAGQTAITFSHLSGDSKNDFKMFTTDDYKFGTDDEEYASSVGGVYKNGFKLSSNSLGRKKLHIDDSSVKNHSVFIDSEEKPLINARLKTNFYQSYHDDLMLKTILPGSYNVNVGQIFNVIIPTQDQKQGLSNNKRSEAVTGKWLLYKITHKMFPIEGTVEMGYVMECEFYKVGLENVHKFRKYEDK